MIFMSLLLYFAFSPFHFILKFFLFTSRFFHFFFLFASSSSAFVCELRDAMPSQHIYVSCVVYRTYVMIMMRVSRYCCCCLLALECVRSEETTERNSNKALKHDTRWKRTKKGKKKFFNTFFCCLDVELTWDLTLFHCCRWLLQTLKLVFVNASHIFFFVHFISFFSIHSRLF